MITWKDVGEFALVVLIVALLAAYLGCAGNPVIPSPPPGQQVPLCSRALLDMPVEYCNLRDADGYDCAVCTGQSSCLSSETFTYCVDDNVGCADKRCF